MEHVHIISQEMITTPDRTLFYIVAALAIAVSITNLFFVRNQKMFNIVTTIAIAMIPLLIIALLIGNLFKVGTGRYSYTGTLDDAMTLQEYRQFEEKYTNIRYNDGVWYWEDKE